MYIPLYMAQMADLDHQPFTNKWTETIKKALQDNDDVMSFIWFDTDFMNPEYTGKYKYVNDILLSDKSKIYKAMTGNEKIPSDKEQDRALSAELFSTYLMPNKWAKNKQVYRFDPELEFSLADSEEIKLPIRVLDRLPYYTFYIQFADEGIFAKNFHGAFINIVKHDPGYILFIERIKEDGRAMFGKVALVPQEADGTFFFDKRSMNADKSAERNNDWQEFGFFLLNAILYLCAENAEIQESQITKSTYKPRSEIKNKFSEIRQWECGFRYGAAVRKKRKEQNTETAKISVKVRRSLPAHTRRAHWHHYWTGPKNGERKLVLHWIAPTFVSGTKNDVAVIHVKK